MNARAEHLDRVLRRRTTATLILLIVQFVIGMATNLYVTIPTHHPGAGSGPYLSGALASLLWSFSSGLPLLIIHVVIGILLLVTAIELVLHSVRSGRRITVWYSSSALVAIVFAAFNGMSFLKYNQNISSLLMSVGFAVAVVSYGLILSNLAA